MIAFEDVSKSFHGRPVLSGISCRIAEGLTTVVMGPSGAGKSVLARLAVGLLRPESGRIVLAGQDITALSDRELFGIRRRIGMCFQEGALFTSMSVGDNVAFPLRRH
ncbi:MAG: ATP-binding cassette domain-containing protein, partial [Cyanobacteria bacterium REEB65]|nr:ATP-binding cassette domain-containing protein [Cyanobacteria bacterium REEB65]